MAGDLARHVTSGVAIWVSIHARAWRATLGARSMILRSACFNSRPRVAGDMSGFPLEFAALSFNSRPRVAGDMTSPGHVPYGWFQFTPARGGRPTRRQFLAYTSFNSRPRVAGDYSTVLLHA